MESYPDDTPSGDKLSALQTHINHILEAIE
jgi:hypothetical protein